jgi:ATP-dependent Clp protease ATP-binding subunit ClpB
MLNFYNKDPNIGDEFVNINATSRKVSMNPLQVLFEREDEFSDKLNSRATFKGFTSLHYAVLTDNLQLIDILLKAGADPLIENDLGHRAYDYCGTNESKNVLENYEKKVYMHLMFCFY